MRKNKIVFILVICLFTLICGCSKEKVNSDNGNSTHIVSKLKNQGDMTEDKKETKNIVLDIPSTADFLYSCNTIKELKEHADLIVKATVKEEHAWVDGVATIGTEYVLEINKCYIGKAQNTIIVNNLGGTILASKYLEKQNDPKMDELKKKVEKNPDNSYVRFQFDWAWQPEKGKQYIWFLEENEENGTITYAPINVYEGVYEIDQDIVKRYNEENTNNSTTRSSQLSDDKMTLSEMEAKINQWDYKCKKDLGSVVKYLFDFYKRNKEDTSKYLEVI